MSLYYHVHLTHGRTEANSLAASFERLQLPLPDQGEFIETSDNGYMVFQEDCGTVIRLISDECFPTLKSDHVLQPLGSLKLGKLRLDVNPGLMTAINEDDVDELVDRLRYENIDYFDFGGANTGWLPYVTKDFPDGYPVVIDAGAVKKLYFGATYDEAAIKYKGIQEKTFGDLKKSFAAALSTPRPDAMHQFWKTCMRQAERGFLKASWTWKEARNIRTVSENYAEKMRAFTPG